MTYSLYLRLKAVWQHTPARLLAIIPGLTEPTFVTQVRPTDANTSGEQLNKTLNNIWDRLFGGSTGDGVVYVILGALAGIALINAGMRYIASANNPEQVKTARTMLLHTILAIVLVVASYTIIRFMIGLAASFGSEVKINR